MICPKCQAAIEAVKKNTPVNDKVILGLHRGCTGKPTETPDQAFFCGCHCNPAVPVDQLSKDA